MAVNVKRYEWNWPGAPTLGGNSAGSLVNLLTTVLVSGWGQKNINTISRVGDTATVYVSTGHEKVAGQCVLHAGWDQAEYNGEFEVTEVVDANNYRVKVPGAPATPGTAGGTPTTKVAPLGWLRPFSGANKAAYKSADTQATGHYLYVDDSYDGYQAAVAGYETMTSLGVGTGVWPLKGSESDSAWTPLFRWVKHNNPSDTTNRPKSTWTIIGDGKRFFFFVDWYSTYTQPSYSNDFYGFGDFTSYGGTSDAFRSFILAESINSTSMGSSGLAWPGYQIANGYYNQTGTGATGRAVCRGWDKLPGGTAFALWTLAGVGGAGSLVSGADGGAQGLMFPQPFGQKIVLTPSYVVDSAKNSIDSAPRSLRGILPGMFCLMHRTTPTDGFIFTDVVGVPNRKFLIKRSGYGGGSNGAVAMDLTGPWE